MVLELIPNCYDKTKMIGILKFFSLALSFEWFVSEALVSTFEKSDAKQYESRWVITFQA